MSILGAYAVPHPPLILPEVGKGEEKKIQNTIDAYHEIAKKIRELKPETIVVLSPHTTMYADYFHISPGNRAKGDMWRFGAGHVKLEAEYDVQFVQTLSEISRERELPAGTLGEREKELDHGTFIPLRILSNYYSDYRLVRIGLSGLSVLDHYRLGKYIAETAEHLNRNTVIIASGDLSHKLKEDGPYGFAPEGPEFDEKVTKALAKGDFLALLELNPDFCEAAAECGLRSFIIMAGALDGRRVDAKLLSYEGPFGVGYAVAEFKAGEIDHSRHFDRIFAEKEIARLKTVKEKEDSYVRLARLSLETYLKTGEKLQLPKDLPEEMVAQRAGVFVSLKKFGQLRGCIGTISPVTGSVAEEIIRNAISAGTEDPRFDPVTTEELPYLVYSVDVLSEPEPISSPRELDVKRYGVIVTSGYKRGLLLPNLPGVNTVDQQIKIAMNKAGIRQGESYSLERFEVVRHT